MDDLEEEESELGPDRIDKWVEALRPVIPAGLNGRIDWDGVRPAPFSNNGVRFVETPISSDMEPTAYSAKRLVRLARKELGRPE
jgi:hypothetical protein